jgi:hypothetical protein
MISVLRIMNRTTTVIVALIAAASLSTIVIGPQQQALAWHHHAAAAAATAAAAAAAVPNGSWQTAPYGDSPDALFFCGAGLRQFTGIGAYGCGNGPEGGTVYPWSIAFGGEFPIGIPPHLAFGGWGCGGFGGGCGGGFGGGCGGIGIGCGDGFSGGPFGLHRHVLQDTTQANNCQRGDGNGQDGPNAASAAVSPSANNTAATNGNAASGSSGGEDASDNSGNPGGNNANAQTSCLNTGVNTAGHGFGGLGSGENGLNQ